MPADVHPLFNKEALRITCTRFGFAEQGEIRAVTGEPAALFLIYEPVFGEKGGCGIETVEHADVLFIQTRCGCIGRPDVGVYVFVAQRNQLVDRDDVAGLLSLRLPRVETKIEESMNARFASVAHVELENLAEKLVPVSERGAL